MARRDMMHIPEKHVLKVQNMDIPYGIIINKRLKNIRMSIDGQGMKVYLPYSMEICEIEKILHKKDGWIIKNYAGFMAAQARMSKRNWEDGEKVLYKGKNKTVHVESCESPGVYVSMGSEGFTVYINDKIDADSRENIIGNAFRKLYMDMARYEINKRIEYFKDIIGVSYNTVRIKDQKTRWGSCSGKRNLNFNWRILMAPPEVMDYVIIHELCHLKYMNHTKQFWSLVEQHMPEYNKPKAWLKENGINLVF